MLTSYKRACTQPAIDSIKASQGSLANLKDSINYTKNLANAYFAAGNFDSGMAYAHNLSSLLKKANRTQEATMVKLNICKTYLFYEKFEACFTCANEVSPQIYAGSNTTDISVINGMYGGYYFQFERNWDKALFYFQKNIQLFEEKKPVDDWSMQYAFQSVTTIFTYKNKYAEALKVVEANLIYAEKARPEIKGSTYVSMANLYRNTKNYRRALEATKEALAIYEKTDLEKRFVLDLYRQIGADYLSLKLNDSGYIFYRKAIDGYIGVGKKENAANLLNYIALQKEEDGDKLTAEKWNQQALALVAPGSDLYESIMHRTYINKMNFILIAKGNEACTRAEKEELRGYLQKIQPRLQAYIAEKKEYINPNDISYYDVISRAYEKVDSFARSLYFTKLSAQLKDSVFGLEKMRSFSDLESKISVERERSRVLLEEEAKRLQLQKEAEIKALQFEFEKRQAAAKTMEERKRLLLEEDLKRREIEFRYKQEQEAIELKFNQEKQLSKIEQEKKDALAQAALSRSRNIRNMSVLGAALALVMLAIAYWSYTQKKKDNLKI
ncbi:MAG: hypothetical protein MUF24_14480, partial [Chitinophagaceae bacterium]|nr:hypothetical protein [Chitinophagaceae bacterium]